jgi:hypothetical protein
VATAAPNAAAVERLLAAMLEPDWVAEDPEAHLLPQIQAVANGPMQLVEASTNEHGELVAKIAVKIPRTDSRRRHMRLLAYSVVSSFAEISTFIEEHEEDGAVGLVVTTGQLAGQSRFAPHGHTVRLLKHNQPRPPFCSLCYAAVSWPGNDGPTTSGVGVWPQLPRLPPRSSACS